MRLITIIILFFIVIIIAAISSYLAISYLTADLNDTIRQLERNIINEEWTQAEITYQKIEKKWDRAQMIITLFVDHSDLRHLNISITRIAGLINIKEKNRLLPEIHVVKNLVNDIRKEEKLSINNVF